MKLPVAQRARGRFVIAHPASPPRQPTWMGSDPMESDPELPVAQRAVDSGQLARLPDYLRHLEKLFRRLGSRSFAVGVV